MQLLYTKLTNRSHACQFILSSDSVFGTALERRNLMQSSSKSQNRANALLQLFVELPERDKESLRYDATTQTLQHREEASMSPVKNNRES